MEDDKSVVNKVAIIISEIAGRNVTVSEQFQELDSWDSLMSADLGLLLETQLGIDTTTMPIDELKTAEQIALYISSHSQRMDAGAEVL